ncbi:MAG: hypothetical protein HF975_04395 [ANME-2 cluster archaeon]|nr:hypothetical protein [ANME-2 cluster archaeon]
MTRLNVIYEPKGRAREYSPLAVNLFDTCPHGCAYCYVPKVLHKKPDEFFRPPQPRKDILQRITSDIRQLAAIDDQREILLCFTCDPYPYRYDDTDDIIKYTTRAAISALLGANLNISILTKGGSASLADIDLLEHFKNQVRYGISLTFNCDLASLRHEPGAAPTSDRISTLKAFHDRGIRTWVSIEPAWSINDTLRIIEKTYEFVDTYMVGKLNYHPHASEVDWTGYTQQVVDKLRELDKEFYIKQDLRSYFKPEIKPGTWPGL